MPTATVSVETAVSSTNCGGAQQLLQLGDAAVDVGFFLLRGVVFSVLAQIAETAGNLDFLGNALLCLDELSHFLFELFLVGQSQFTILSHCQHPPYMKKFMNET